MKTRKNLFLDSKAVARGEQVARELNLSLSALVEKQLLAIPPHGEEEEFWPGPAMKPIDRPGDPRSAYLKRKHA